MSGFWEDLWVGVRVWMVMPFIFVILVFVFGVAAAGAADKAPVMKMETARVDLSAQKSVAPVKKKLTSGVRTDVLSGAAQRPAANALHFFKVGIQTPNSDNGMWDLGARPESGWDRHAATNAWYFECEAFKQTGGKALRDAWWKHINEARLDLQTHMTALIPQNFAGARMYHLRIRADGKVLQMWDEFQPMPGDSSNDFPLSFPKSDLYDKLARECIRESEAAGAFRFPAGSQMKEEDVTVAFNSNTWTGK